MHDFNSISTDSAQLQTQGCYSLQNVLPYCHRKRSGDERGPTSLTQYTSYNNLGGITMINTTSVSSRSPPLAVKDNAKFAP